VPFINDKSIINPSSIVARPATLCPPPRTATSRPLTASQPHGIDHVGHAAAAGDQRRPLVHQPVMHLSRVFVVGVAWLQQLPGEPAEKRRYGFGNRLRNGHRLLPGLVQGSLEQ
jgi:hypothetical protein